MVWNKPNDNKPELDPWGKKNSNNKNHSGNNSETKNTISDVKKFLCSLKKIINYNSNSSHSSNSSNSSYSSKKIINPILIIIFISFFIWCISGFYTIKEAERGVVTSFGKFSHLVEPGLNWKPIFFHEVQAINVETVRELATSGIMLTADENVVRVEMNVQYKITDPKNYLFSVLYPDDSLRQATDSALRGVIGHSTMDRVLTEGRTLVRSDTQKEIEEIIKPYNMGITILDVNFQTARPPEEVKAAFDDAIAARENREQYIREAEAYSNEVQPKANGRAQRILEEAKAYSSSIILKAQGEVARFNKILPQYKLSKKITLKRLYIESMERLLQNNKKIFIDKKDNSAFFISLDNFFSNMKSINNHVNFQKKNILKNKKNNNKSDLSSLAPENILEERRVNSVRSDFKNMEKNKYE
ncbi:FtsH protease activity modulator HflK [Buchnera aphidicola]|uniref:Protein HflK n=1 Tax=Buchnera aphidicola str. Ua (Uroleucon ambrosiae) TaxID=1005057 RepID=G2LQ45_BUCUM|nr:FtsH protease activity modulator HflK [Buchnera aphidicola]AEO08332.1 HflK protein [Buchnera aphidicola str. Ua (Uroleucon ambrosiae)]